MASNPLIRVALVETNPLLLLGFRSPIDSETHFDFIAASLADIGNIPSIDLVLLGNSYEQNLFEMMASSQPS